MRIFATTILAASVSLTAIAQPAGEFEASIVGEVNSQGKANFKAGSTLQDLWLFAGGATSKADPKSAILLRDGREIDVELEALDQVRLLPGDILSVSPAKRLTVQGEVQRTGTFGISSKSQSPVEDALAAAGGTKKNAAIHRVLLVRASMRKPVVLDLSASDSAGALKLPLPLEDGDILCVPPMRCALLGKVPNQGQVLLHGNDTLREILDSSGIRSDEFKRVFVVRAADVEAGNDQRETYDVQASGIPSVPILDGDVIFVPEDGRGLSIPFFSPQPFYYDRVLFSI